MSSRKSQPYSPAEPADALLVALVTVCEKSFFAFVEVSDSARFAERVQALGGTDGSAWLMATINFSRWSDRGALDVVLPERLARSLVISLLGAASDVELPEAQVLDGIGEFANMVCGAWLTDLGGSQAFELGPPVVTRMARDWDPTGDGKGLRLSVNDLPMQLRVRVSETDAA